MSTVTLERSRSTELAQVPKKQTKKQKISGLAEPILTSSQEVILARTVTTKTEFLSPKIQETALQQLKIQPKINLDTSLFDSIEKGDIEKVKALIEQGANIRAKTTQSKITPLHKAIFFDQTDIAKLLVKKLTVDDINMPNRRGMTPLQYAVHKKNTVVTQLLIDSNANLEVEGPQGMTSLCLASQEGSGEIVKLLLEGGANTENRVGPPLVLATNRGHLDVVQLLIKHKANVNYQIKKTGHTALHIACQLGRTAIVSDLLDAGADTAIKNKQGQNSLFCAMMSGHFEIIDLFTSRGVTDYCGSLAVRLPAASLGDPAVRSSPASLAEILREMPEEVRPQVTFSLARSESKNK